MLRTVRWSLLFSLFHAGSSFIHFILGSFMSSKWVFYSIATENAITPLFSIFNRCLVLVQSLILFALGRRQNIGRQDAEDDIFITVSKSTHKNVSITEIYLILLSLPWKFRFSFWNWCHYEGRGLGGILCSVAGDLSASAGELRDSRFAQFFCSIRNTYN